MRKRLVDKFKYSFDNAMSRGLLPLVGLLSLVTGAFIVLVTIIVTVFRLFPVHEHLTWGEVAWRSLLRTLDPGTMASDDGLGFRVAMLVVTLFGVVLVATLIGIISNALSARVDQLRKGRSDVLEDDHTVILGWNGKAVQIISELIVANMSKKHASIVILADKDKLSIEDEIHQRIKSFKTTRVVVRNGDPMSKIDLGIVAIHKARSIIILSPEMTTDADSFSIKTCLALKNLELAPKPDCSIVAEIRSYSNMEAAELVGEGKVHWILAEDLINRLIAQSCRQAGISGAFTDLLDFEGSELYFYSGNEIIGKSYRELSLKLNHACVVGIINNHQVTLNPASDYILAVNDQLIVLAEDDSQISFGNPITVDSSLISNTHSPIKQIERILVIGSNSGLEYLLQELDRDLLPGSEITLVASNIVLHHQTYENFDLRIVSNDPTSHVVLESVNPASFDHIIILATREGLDIQSADARTLLSLLHLRVLTKNSAVNIVTEILDDHNRELVETNRVDDFIVSDKLVSHAIAQYSENSDLQPVFNQLFSSSGPNLLMAPVERYLPLDTPIPFALAVEAGHRFNESVVGYRSEALKQEAGELHGVRLNPLKDAEISFAKGDKLIVISSE